MTTFKNLAAEMSKAFEGRKRDNGEEFRTLKDGSPAWMTDILHKAHGDMFPDDYRYRFIESAVDHFANVDDADDDDGRHGAVDSAVDVYNGRLTAWLASNLRRIEYCDDAAEEFGNPDSLVKLIQYGQYAEIDETFGMVASALAELASDDDDSSDDDKTPFKVEGVDSDDGSRTLLAEFDNSGEARAFLTKYTSSENAGNWNLIEVYDTRGEDSERLWFWERDDATA